jgi:hypothetical protein
LEKRLVSQPLKTSHLKKIRFQSVCFFKFVNLFGSYDAAVMALGWSADASQLASAERGGVSRIWTVGTAGGGGKKGEKGKKAAKAKPAAAKKDGAGGATEMGAALVLAPVNHSSSSPLPDPAPPQPGSGDDDDEDADAAGPG